MTAQITLHGAQLDVEAYQINDRWIVCATACSGKKSHKNIGVVTGGFSLQKPIKRKTFPCQDVIMIICFVNNILRWID